jgi:hypothetical protein
VQFDSPSPLHLFELVTPTPALPLLKMSWSPTAHSSAFYSHCTSPSLTRSANRWTDQCRLPARLLRAQTPTPTPSMIAPPAGRKYGLQPQASATAQWVDRHEPWPYLRRRVDDNYRHRIPRDTLPHIAARRGAAYRGTHVHKDTSHCRAQRGSNNDKPSGSNGMERRVDTPLTKRTAAVMDGACGDCPKGLAEPAEAHQPG